MDFIYSRLNNNLVDINRLDKVLLLKCEKDGEPIKELKVGDYYLKFTVIDSDKVNYCDLSSLNNDYKDLLDKLYEEQERAIKREDNIENTSANNLEITQDEQTGIVTINLLNIHGDILDTKTLDLETEKIIRSIDLDYENKKLIFHLVDGTNIEADISAPIDDFTNKFNQLIEDVNNSLEGVDEALNTLHDQVVDDENYFKERCLYKSTTNASRWESKEGSFTGYLGGTTETDVKAKIGLSMEKSSPYLPTYPIVHGTYNVLNSEENSITGKLNLTPINGNASPLFSFTGSGTASMGQRNIYLDNSWFTQSTNNINLCIPAKSGTLITVADAMGSLDIEVDDIDVTKVKLTDSQYNYLLKYPKSTFALHDLYMSDKFRYFTKVYDSSASYPTTAKFITLVDESRIGYANIVEEENELYLNIIYTNISSQEELNEVRKLLNQEISDRKSAISEEQTARKQSDATLQENIDIEAKARDDADWELQQNIDTEHSRAQREENDIRANLASKAQALQTTIDKEISDRKEAINQLTDEITAAEEGIDEALNTEVEARKAADEQIIQDTTNSFEAVKDELEVMDNEVQTEIEERKAADEDIKEDLDNEVTIRKNEVKELQDECANITQGIQEFSNSVNITFQEKEEEITKNADNITKLNEGLNNYINQTDIHLDTLDGTTSSLQTSITALSNKEAGDVLGIQQSIAKEIEDRTTADTTLTDNLNTEITRAKEKEASIENDFTTEITNRENGDKETLVSSKNYTDEKFTSESSERKTEDESLQKQIDTLTNDLSKEVDTREDEDRALLDKVTTWKAEVDNNVINISNNLSSEILNRENSDKKLETAIEKETNYRIEADTDLSNKLSIETQARVAADNTIEDSLNTEVTKRTNADKTLQANIDKLTSDKQDNLTDVQLAAVNSGITSSKVAVYDNYKSLIDKESTTRETTDNDLQSQIDAITNSTDVVDVVGTYTELENYDKSKLTDNDIIKVLKDEKHNNQISYYKYSKSNDTFSLVGSVGPYYTISETDAQIEKEANLRKTADDELKTSINTEIDTRTSECTKLQTQIETEEARAIAKETELANAIDSIDDKQSSDVKKVAADLASEITRATTEESNISSKLTTEISRANKAEEDLTTLINNENVRALAAEATLTTSLNAEITRATTTEEANTKAISDEITRASNAETTLTASLNAEIKRAKEKEDSLDSALALEITNREDADASLKYVLDQNIEKALIEGRTYINNKMGVEASERSTQDVALDEKISNLSSELASEITNRTTADKELKDYLDTEVTNRTNADADLTASISSLSTTVGENYTLLNNNLNAETTRAKTEESRIEENCTSKEKELTKKIEDSLTEAKSYTDTNIITEASTRSTKDDELQKNIDAANLKIEATASAIRQEIPTKVSQLENDGIYITKDVDNLTNYYSSTTIDEKLVLKLDADKLPTKLSAFENDKNFIDNTVADLTNYTTTTDLDKKLANKLDSTTAATTYETKEAANTSYTELKAKDTELASAIDEKQSKSDNTLTTISKEIVGAINELNTDISSESSRAIDAENTLQNSIDTALDNGLAYVDNKVGDEKTRATAKESELEEKITSNSTNISTLTTSVGNLEIRVSSIETILDAGQDKTIAELVYEEL